MPEINEKKILIIDDEKELCALLDEYFSEEGYLIDSAHDGQSGVEKVKTFKPDIILLDYRMPGWDGSKVLKMVREFSSSPIICVSAVTDQETIDECLRLGAISYMLKPINLDELSQAIRSKLNTKEQ